ncbi:MAG: hypothetical protein JWM57_3012 [Phycisphaerales bacterium]|nr:hypothetical protein [Phycisphaerales bacterium]
MRFQRFSLAVLALSGIACSTTTSTPATPVAAEAPTTTFASQQAELDYLRAENAKLRGQVQGVSHENIVMRNKTAVAEAKQKVIQSGRLEPGLTVQEANMVITGSPELYKDTCKLISQTDSEWTYRITSDAPVTGPGSGSTGSIGTNMRSGLTPTIQTWNCTFDARTGKLTRFQREKLSSQ